MAGVKGQNTGNKNAEGNKGGNGAPSVQDRELSKRVRSLTLEKIEDILNQPVVKMKHDDYDLYKAILIKLAGTVLPRLNEVTGEDGESIKIGLDKETLKLVDDFISHRKKKI